MTSSQTRTATQTSTYSRVVYVTRKLQADLFNLVDSYSQITESYAEELIHDFRIFLDEEALDEIRLLWKRRNSSQVFYGYSYKVLDGTSGLVDDRSGGIRYRSELLKHDFFVRIFYSSRWYSMSEEEKREIKGRCKHTWSKGSSLSYVNGVWTSDRTYAKDDYGLQRNAYGG